MAAEPVVERPAVSVDSLPLLPELRAKIYAALDPASLTQVRLVSRAFAWETRLWQHNKLQALKPEKMPSGDLEADLQAFEQLGRSTPVQSQDAWTWQMLADKPQRQLFQWLDAVKTADAKALPKLLKQICAKQQAYPNEARYHYAAAALYARLGDSKAAAALDLRLLRAHGSFNQSDQEAYLLPSAERMLQLAGRFNHWSKQASYLLDVMHRKYGANGSPEAPGLRTSGFSPEQRQLVADRHAARWVQKEEAWLETPMSATEKMAAHGVIALRCASQGDGSGTAKHIEAAGTLCAALDPAEAPLGHALLQLLVSRLSRDASSS